MRDLIFTMGAGRILLHMTVEKGFIRMLPFPRREVATSAVADVESEEITDPTATLSSLEVKASIMQDMITNHQVYQPVIGKVRWLVRDLWFSNLVSNSGIEGLGNLHWALAWAKSQNKGIRFLGPHVADADHEVLENSLGKEGLKMRDELVFLGGANMKRRPSIDRFTRAANVIYNVTPRDEHHLKKLIKRKEEFGFSEEQVKRLEEVKRTFSLMNRKSMRAVVENCVRRKKPMVAYIEGGRSYDGYLRPPQEEFSAIIPDDDSVVIIPYRLYGSRELNPPGQDPKILKKHLIPGFRQKVGMVVGEPYLSSEVWEVYRSRIQAGEGANGQSVNPMEWPMANIANLDQRFVRPEELQHYADLMERFAPQRNRIIIPGEKNSLPARIDGKDYPILRHTYPDNWVHTLGRRVLGDYLNVWHDFDVQLDKGMPKTGPALFLTNHNSNLTTVALMVADPYYPWTTVPIKSGLFKIPVVKQVLNAWGAIPVNRDGRDKEAATNMLNLLKQGRTVCIAAEGTRSKDGRLQPMDSSLVGLTLIAARRGYPVIPLAVLGAYQALPPGARFPKSERITVIGGKSMDLSPWTSQKSTLEVKTEAARYIQTELATLLPEDQKPGPDTKPMWDKEEYLKPKKKRKLFGRFL